jgi:hypothetical protein
MRRVPGDVEDARGSVAVQMSQATRIVTSVLRSVGLPSPASPLLTISSGRRILAMAQLDLLPVRRIRAHYGGTVNDVLLAVVTGGLREWLVAGGDPIGGLFLRAFIPVSQRARSSNRTGETGCRATSASCRSANPIPASGYSQSGGR